LTFIPISDKWNSNRLNIYWVSEGQSSYC